MMQAGSRAHNFTLTVAIFAVILLSMLMARTCASQTFIWGGTSEAQSEVAWWYGKGVNSATGDWKDVGAAKSFDIKANWPGLLAQSAVTIGCRAYKDVVMEKVENGQTVTYTEHRVSSWTTIYWTPKAWATEPTSWTTLRLEVTR